MPIGWIPQTLRALGIVCLGTSALGPLAGTAQAQAFDTVTGALTDSLATEDACKDTNSVTVGLYPLEADRLPMAETAASLLYDTFLGRLLEQAPACAQFVDARGAYVTVEYTTRSAGFEQTAQMQRQKVEQALRDVDYVIELSVNAMAAGPILVAALIDMGSARAVHRSEAPIPERFMIDGCAQGAQPVTSALQGLATQIANRVAPIDRIARAGAWYAYTDNTTAVASFLEERFIDALSRKVENTLTGQNLDITDARTSGGDDMLVLKLRYWPCEGDDAALVSVTMTDQTRLVRGQRTVRLDRLPQGMEIRPMQRPNGSLELSPVRATADDQLTLLATPPGGCQPFFFHLSPSGEMTPIPMKYFRRVEVGGSRTQFEASPQSEYGLFVTAEDEQGQHRIGYVCQPDRLVADMQFRDILRAVRDKSTKEDEGVLAEDLSGLFFQVRRFEVHF